MADRDWPALLTEWNGTDAELAAHLGCTQSAVWHQRRRYNVPNRNPALRHSHTDARLTCRVARTLLDDLVRFADSTHTPLADLVSRYIAAGLAGETTRSR